MKWVPRYAWKMVVWSFAKWRIQQAVVGVISAVGGVVGMQWFGTHFQAIAISLIVWLAILTLVVAPSCLWHDLDERLQLTDQSRPWVTIDGYEQVVAEDDVGEEYRVETLHIVNRGNVPAVSIAIRPVQGFGRTVRLLNPLPTLGPNESTDAQILSLSHVLEGVNKKVPKIMGRPWSVRIPLTVEYCDLNHIRWTTDHAITLNAFMGISINIVHPNEPQEWTDVSLTKD